MRIAVPTNAPGGLEAERSDHFGHCELFTMVELDANQEIGQISLIENGDHQAGGCLVPVKVLQDAGAEAIIVGGMGARPMNGFNDVGIAVYFADRAAYKNVQAVVDAYVADKLPRMQTDQVCKGSGSCHH